ncbi:Uncharacterized protein OBRU01_16033 [Operophtera brumata]|uniref:Uncharacterized protein n=1 Tax=Operophtera brumata TaxID=104452 RepID=A0A0L7KTU4_OPEBR|nr:Uncharacterized protein OBRU01_16033 [Operophtera brumata]
MPLGKIESFDINDQNWHTYVRRVKQFIALNEVKETLHVSTLVTLVGPQCYDLMCDLCAPDLPEDKSWAVLVKLIKDHLEPERSEIAERHKRSIHTLVPLPLKSTTAESGNEPSTTVQSNVVNLRNNKPKAPKSTKWSKLLVVLLMSLQLACTTTFTRELITQDLVKIKSVTSQFDKLCDKSKRYVKETYCSQFHHHLKEEKAKIERNKEYWTEGNKPRRRRGLLKQLLTSVFGVNDEVYRDIDSLNEPVLTQ